MSISSSHTPRTYAWILAVSLLGGLVVAASAAPDEPQPSPIEALAFLAGEWERVTPDGGVFTASYTGPEGGRVLGMTKQVEGGRVTFFEFETIAAVGSQVVLTPYPAGRPAATFTLERSSAREVVFVSPGNEFPNRIRYALTSRGTLAIDLNGVQGNREVALAFELFRPSR